MGSTKVRCLGCGAKNEANAHRCRVCTTIINMYPQDQEPAAPAPAGVLDDHFDAGSLDRQLRPAKATIGEKGGALGARIAAANAAKAGGQPAPGPAPMGPTGPASPVSPAAFAPQPQPTEAFGPTPSFYDVPAPAAAPVPTYEPPPSFGPPPGPEPAFDPAAAIVFETPAAPVEPVAPLEYEHEKFDPNALFADKQGEGEFF